MGDVELGDLQDTNKSVYVDFLKSIEDRWPEYRPFRMYLEARFEPPYWPLSGDIQVCDTLSDNRKCSSPLIRAREDGSTARLLDTLQNYPTELRSRVVLFGIDQSLRLDQRVFNILRLTFNIEPLFFWSLLETRIPLPRRYSILRMGDMVSKLMKNFPTPSGDISVCKRSRK